MRVDPKIISPEEKDSIQKRTEAVTRKAALVLAFVCVFYFFVKLLFL